MRHMLSIEFLDVLAQIDELNSYLGLIRTKAMLTEYRPEIVTALAEIQTTLCKLYNTKFEVSGENIHYIKGELTKLNSIVPHTTDLIIAGGTELSSYTYISKSLCLRIEAAIRKIKNDVSNDFLSLYFSYLSEFLYVLARYFVTIADKKEFCIQN